MDRMWNISQGYRVRKSRAAVRGDVSARTHYGAVRVWCRVSCCVVWRRLDTRQTQTTEVSGHGVLVRHVLLLRYSYMWLCWRSKKNILYPALSGQHRTKESAYREKTERKDGSIED